MVDEAYRSAARIAALVALPVAVLAGLGFFAVLNGAGSGSDPEPSTHPGATGPVATEERELTEPEATACRALLSQLPAELDGLAQRRVTAGAEQNAAYGDPPIVLACGVPPAEYAPTDQVYPLPAGENTVVCWHAAERDDATVWSTLDRRVQVRVTVPAGYDGPGQLVTELSVPVVIALRPAPAAAPPGCAT